MGRCEKIVREFVKDNNYQLVVKIVDPDYPIWEGSIKDKDKLILLIQHIPTNEAYGEEELFKELFDTLVFNKDINENYELSGEA